MSQKNTSAQQSADKIHTQTNSRRTLLKSTIASGAIIGGSALSTGWHKPVINSVLLPAHATTSMPQGDFIAADVMPITLLNDQINSVQYALLNTLISPANADHIIRGTCDTDGDADDANGLISIHFRITGTDVEIALSVGDSDEITLTNCSGGTSTLSATNMIADVPNIDITNGTNISLTNMQATATQVTGTWTATGNGEDGLVTCDNTFAANLGGTFPDNVECISA